MTKQTISVQRKSSVQNTTPSPRAKNTACSPRKDSARTPRKESARRASEVLFSHPEDITGAAEKYDSIPALRIQRRELLDQLMKVDFEIESMFRMKASLQKLCTVMEEFSASIFQLNRNNQGVPYVANVKALMENMFKDFNSSLVQGDIIMMNHENIPFVRDLNVQFGNIHKLCETIIVTHTSYHVTYLEDFHMVAGKIRGMLKTIMVMFYDDETAVDDEEEYEKSMTIEYQVSALSCGLLTVSFHRFIYACK